MTVNICINLTKIGIFCIFLILNTACKEHRKTQEYYYEVYEILDSVPQHYQAIKIIDKNGIREQITYRYSDINKKLTGKSIEYYKILGNNILKLNNINDSGKLYISTEYIDSCITYSTGNNLHDLVASIIHCYRGRRIIKSNENKWITSYEFSKSYGTGMGNVSYRVFYDTSFIPIKTERISGYSNNDSILRISSIPSEFKSLLNKEQDWCNKK